MSDPVDRPVLTLYTRSGCEHCAEARDLLQGALEERTLRDQPVPIVRQVDVDTDPRLAARYGALVPVVTLGGAELPLVTSGRQLRAFLSAALPALA